MLAGAVTDAEADVALVELEKVAVVHDDALEHEHEAAELPLRPTSAQKPTRVKTAAARSRGVARRADRGIQR